MGQTNSKQSIQLKSIQRKSIESIDTIECNCTNFQLFEFTPYNYLKKGEMYKIEIYYDDIEIIASFKHYYLYDNIQQPETEYSKNCGAVFRDTKTPYNNLIVDGSWEWDFYRIISRKEYMTRVKEKYNQTVLNVILKRLINDEFKW